MSESNDKKRIVAVHRALMRFNKRAERSNDDQLVATFVDSEPLYDLLSTENNQVIYGRRGTGKTHALKYHAEQVEKGNSASVYIDLRNVGSNGSIYSDASRPLAERSSALIIDVLNALFDELTNIAIMRIDDVLHPDQVTDRIEDLRASITSVRITGTVEEASATEDGSERSLNADAALSKDPQLKLSLGNKDSSSRKESRKAAGVESIHLDFGNISASLRGLIQILGLNRIWLLVDEWSEIPILLQPYLADLMRRTILPIPEITVKIAAIEHRTEFTILKDRGEYIGVELGADMSADLNLDHYLVFDNNQGKATDFFKTLLYKHYASTEGALPEVQSGDDLVQIVFTQTPAFEEFVRAVEGVPRDAINLAAAIATKAFGEKVSINHVRASALEWYQQDKSAVIKNSPELSKALNFIIDEIIGNRRARAFLFPSNSRHELIEKLFDARLLHVLKRSVSSRDEPGVRYDVYKIDYGCYVELINTSKAPLTLFEADEESIEVPRDDYRSIRRAILRPEELDAVMAAASA